MNFLDGSLFPENQQKLVITAAPYGPEWMPADFPEDIPVSMAAQIQKAVDCYNAGATVVHIHVREQDGKGSKRLSKFNELLAGIRARVPQLILQVGGSISFAPEAEGEVAKWLSDDTRHMLAELQPRPDQVTIAINTNQMNVVEQMCEADLAGTSMAEPAVYRAYREMTIPAGPEWVEEHIRRLSAAGIQTHFQLANIAQLETVERMMRRGSANVPLILTWVAIGGGFDAPNIYNLSNFVRACPDGSVLTLETSMLNVLPLNMMAIALGLHVRCGIEDNLWTQRRDRKMSSVEQIEQLVRISREFGRDIAERRGSAARSTGSARSTAMPTRRSRRMALHRIASPRSASRRVARARRESRRAVRPDRSRPARSRRRALANAARSQAREDAQRAHGAAARPQAPELRRARSIDPVRAGSDRRSRHSRCTQRRRDHARALGAVVSNAQTSQVRCWPRRPISKRRCQTAIRPWRRCGRKAGCRYHAAVCPFPASSRRAATIPWHRSRASSNWRTIGAARACTSAPSAI